MSVIDHPLAVRIGDWIAKRHGTEYGDVLLDRKRVYILPTRAGVVFAAAVSVMLVGSINYDVQLGFVLTFLVASMAIVGMYHTHRNLARIVLRAQGVENVFAGDVLSFELGLRNPTPEARWALQFSFVLPQRRNRRWFFTHDNTQPAVWKDLPANSDGTVRLPLPTRRRGRRACPRVRIATKYPLGLWQAWAYYTPPLSAVVYPQPENDAPQPPLTGAGTDEGVGSADSGDDFAGVRPYQAGDPQKMIAWRLAARSDELSVRLFETHAGGEMLLDYAALPVALDAEQRLSRLTRWVLMAEAIQARYALQLPGTLFEPAINSRNSARNSTQNSAEHRERCLIALALFAPKNQ